ncbi:hypothetical protein K466DRAFT_582589 [Polyporus arcularius HHB13444]|uniref:Uncharacterized protein n=1 Tax=Polyporus arcularius HHB13444 TaxID=1314778 RepID=A0A5C3PTH2_9APHY|nr:hypothetical protein K466DRAFT_582589 [Polyporus arcularius HHB13444]
MPPSTTRTVRPSSFLRPAPLDPTLSAISTAPPILLLPAIGTSKPHLIMAEVM